MRVVTPRDAWTVRAASPTSMRQGPSRSTGRSARGARADGTVTLTGQGLDAPGLSVSFGGEPVALVPSAVTSTTAIVTVPSRGALPRVVTVTASQGTASVGLQEGTPQTLPVSRDTIERTVSRRDGRARGRRPTASRCSGVRRRAGGPATSVQGETRLRFISPPGASGPASDLHVQAASDPENEAVLPAAFRYEAPLMLGQVEPAQGAIAGGTLVTLRGEGLERAPTVTFGGEPARDVQRVDVHTLTCRTPPSSMGTVEVAVTRGSARPCCPKGSPSSTHVALAACRARLHRHAQRHGAGLLVWFIWSAGAWSEGDARHGLR